MSAEEFKDKGNKFYVQKQYKEAIEGNHYYMIIKCVLSLSLLAYTEAINLSPDAATYYTNRAAAYLMVLQYKEALNDCEKAIAIDKTNSKAYFRSATALKGLGRIDAAINILNEGLNYDNSDNAKSERDNLLKAKNSIPIIKGNINGNQQQLFSALTEIDNVIRNVGSNFRDINVLKAEVLLKLKKLEEAYNLTNNMMRNTNGSSDFELLSIRSKILYAMGDMENTLKHLQQAVRLDPDNTTIRSYCRD
jgi:DnaJ family protein C protein 7